MEPDADEPSHPAAESDFDDVAFHATAIDVSSDADRELLIESQCCITGVEVKHSFCRYPDRERGAVMVMSHDAMLKYSRPGQSLVEVFEKILVKRREAEKRTRSRAN